MLGGTLRKIKLYVEKKKLEKLTLQTFRLIREPGHAERICNGFVAAVFENDETAAVVRKEGILDTTLNIPQVAITMSAVHCIMQSRRALAGEPGSSEARLQLKNAQVALMYSYFIIDKNEYSRLHEEVLANEARSLDALDARPTILDEKRRYGQEAIRRWMEYDLSKYTF